MHHQKEHQQVAESARQGDQDPQGADQAAPRECCCAAGLQGVEHLREPGDGGECGACFKIEAYIGRSILILIMTYNSNSNQIYEKSKIQKDLFSTSTDSDNIRMKLSSLQKVIDLVNDIYR